MDTLVDAYLLLRKDPKNAVVPLRLGGSCGPADEPFVQAQLQKLKSAGVSQEVEVHPNLSRDQKIAFLKSLSVFSVPAKYGEAFGLYVVEAMAAGVPVVQPRTASYPEIIEASGGGVLCEPNDPRSLAKELQALLDHPEKSRALGASGRAAALEQFSSDSMARSILAKYEQASRRKPALAGARRL
jgi:glycosyltransferase involved in cell wall biosynthesis